MNDEPLTINKKKIIALVITIVLVASFLIVYQLYEKENQPPNATGGMEPEPDETINVTLNESFNVTIKNNEEPEWVFVNDIEPDDIRPYMPYVKFTNYSEENYTWTAYIGNASKNFTGIQQTWFFLANQTGEVDLYFFRGEYPDPDLIGYTQDYWVHINVEGNT